MNFLLLVMENYLLEACQEAIESPISHKGLPEAIDAMEVSTLTVDTCNFASYAPITNRQTTILKAMDIQPPKNYKI